LEDFAASQVAGFRPHETDGGQLRRRVSSSAARPPLGPDPAFQRTATAAVACSLSESISKPSPMIAIATLQQP
jgi:hypothetical protein